MKWAASTPDAWRTWVHPHTGTTITNSVDRFTKQPSPPAFLRNNILCNYYQDTHRQSPLYPHTPNNDGKTNKEDCV